MNSSRLPALLISLRPLTVRALATAAKPAERPPHSRDAATGSRIYVLGSRKQPELEFSEALRALRAYSLSESVETVGLNVVVDMTIKKDKVREPFKGPLVYPHRFGNERIVLFVLESSLHQAAQDAGADIVGGEELLPDLEEESLKFDVCLCTPSLLERFKPLQRKLKAKMPNVRRGTVVPEDAIAEAVMRFKTSREFTCDKTGTVRVPVGKLDFPNQHITDNCSCVLEAVLSHRGNLPRASFIKSALLTSTYGPAFPASIRPLL